MFLDVSEPLSDVVEGLCVGDVVHQHDAHRTAVVRSRDRVEALLTSGIPNLQILKNLLSWIFKQNEI